MRDMGDRIGSEGLRATREGRRRLTAPSSGRSTPGLPLSVLRDACMRLLLICDVLFVTLAFTWLGTNWT